LLADAALDCAWRHSARLLNRPGQLPCRVIALEGDTLTLEPHPDPSLHPLSHQRALRLAKRQAEADWWEQEDVNDGHAPGG
jgi:hypothetical protein